jgi:hypothetical protein
MVLTQYYLLTSGKFEWIKIRDDFLSGLDYIANNANLFYFESNDEAPRGKVVRYNLDKPVCKERNLTDF